MGMLPAAMRKHLGDPMQWYGAAGVPSEEALLSMIHEIVDMPSGGADDFYRGLVVSDSYLLAGRYAEALTACPKPCLGQQWALLSSRRLNLLHANGMDPSAQEALALFPKRLTAYGQENVERVAVIVDARMRELSQEGGILDAVIRREGNGLRTSFIVYNGTFYSKEVPIGIPYFDFKKSSSLRATIRDLSRLAENTLREEAGLPNVGEGWLSETRLYYELREALPHLRIVQHASPEWLGRQHLDIYFPDLECAVEYQGSQHEQPVAYFGGQEAFEEQRKRDRRKESLCTRHRVKLLHVCPGYDLASVVGQVVSSRPHGP